MESNANIKNIIFDLGGVLVDWNPDKVYKHVFKNDPDKMAHFFNKVCTQDWNENQDAGYPMAKATCAKGKSSRPMMPKFLPCGCFIGISYIKSSE